MSTKSDFVFLEDDNDEEITIYYFHYWYDHRIISEFDFADLLYQNSRYRTNRDCKQSSISTRADVNTSDHGDYRTVFYRMMEDGRIRYGEFGT